MISLSFVVFSLFIYILLYMATILYLFLYVSVDGVNVNAGGGLCVRAWLRARARNHITMTPWNIAKVSGDYLFMMGQRRIYRVRIIN